MAIFNYAHKEITAKIVYYGAALCGKTTNLRYIYNNVDSNRRNDLISLETEGDRTLFFDLLPIEIGKVKGFNLRLQLYTVPGQVYYNATRKLVLNGTDGVVFVADSQTSRLDANVESFENLIENLNEQGIKITDIPWMLQINKRDLPNIAPVGKILSILDFKKYDVPYTKAVATDGTGVFDTLKIISKMVVRSLERKLIMPEEKEEQGSLLSRIASAKTEKAKITPEIKKEPVIEEPVEQESNDIKNAEVEPENNKIFEQTDSVEIQPQLENEKSKHTGFSSFIMEDNEFVNIEAKEDTENRIEEEIDQEMKETFGSNFAMDENPFSNDFDTTTDNPVNNDMMISQGETDLSEYNDFKTFDEMESSTDNDDNNSINIRQPNDFLSRENEILDSDIGTEVASESDEMAIIDHSVENIKTDSIQTEQTTGKEVALAEYTIDENVLKIIPPDLITKFRIVPLRKVKRTLEVAMVDPNDVFVIDDIRFLTGLDIKPIKGSPTTIQNTINKYYADISTDVNSYSTDIAAADDTGQFDLSAFDADKELNAIADDFGTVDLAEGETAQANTEVPEYINQDLNDIMTDVMDNVEVDMESSSDKYLYTEIRTDDAPIVKMVNALLVKAYKEKASDVHFEPYEKEFRVRFRSDGKLRTVQKLPISTKNPVISRLKIMANLDISERRVPQDGRIKLKIGGNAIDFRTSILPTLFGEKAVLRLLDMSNLSLDLAKLGFEEQALKDFLHAIHLPYGIILVTGPTGSGKSTTLYSALSLLNKDDVNIMTAEDPVEFNFAGINQVQIDEAVGRTFPAALRSFLRQDPDVILVGEIRDLETAEIAIQAALTGHLVLSTLHTNDAPSTISRLLNMGVKNFLIAAALKLVVAQRLARRICSNCKEEKELTEKDIKLLLNAGATEEELKDAKLYYGKGCEKCNYTGYKGRTALFEVMVVEEDKLGELILNNASTSEIRNEARKHGMMTLRESGIKQVLKGITTLEEVLNVTM